MDGLDTTMKARMGEMKKGLKYGASLLKSTMREVASNVPSPSPSSTSRSSKQADEFVDGPALVHYHLQGPKETTEDTDNCFLIAQNERANGVTKGLIRKFFPVKGNFLLRFKTFDSMFGHTWTDLQDSDVVPLYMGQIEVKVFKLPDAVTQRTLVSCLPTSPSQASSPSPHSPQCIRPSPMATSAAGVSDAMPDLLFGEAPRQPPASVQVARPAATANNYANLQTREEIRKRNEDMVNEKTKAAGEVFANRVKAEENAIAAKLKVAEVLSSLLDKWAFNSDGSVKDCRTLLGTIPDVMWADCTFTPTSIPDMMMSSAKVKRAYRSCIIVFHPDKHQGAEADIVYRAERIFQHVNDAWDIMRKKEANA